MVNISFVGNIVGSILYSDLVDIYRMQETTKTNGATITSIPATPTHANVKCHLSYPVGNYTRFPDSVDTVPYKVQPKLSLLLGTDVLEGDFLSVSKVIEGEVQKVYEGVAGVPLILGSHIEVPINDKGDS